MQTESQESGGLQAETPEKPSGTSIPFSNPKKSKPVKVLPSDRLSLEKQLEVLRAFVVASEAESGAPVTNEQAGKIIGMAAMTVVVVNAFFKDIGLLSRTDSGLFSPSQAAKDYQAAYEWDKTKAGLKLATAFEDKWFAQILTPRLKMRSLKKADALAVLAEASKCSPEYQPQLEMILNFLSVAGIVSFDGDEIRAAGDVGDRKQERKNGGGSDDPPPPPPKEGIIPDGSPFTYLDPKRQKKVTIVTDHFVLDKAEMDRLIAWIGLTFFLKEGGTTPNQSG